MLSRVSKTAPPALAAPLEEFNQYSRHALNSYVHSGIHALHRTRHGYPAEMAVAVVKFSNGLSHLGYRLAGDFTPMLGGNSTEATKHQVTDSVATDVLGQIA